jgi:hypothetical protein
MAAAHLQGSADAIAADGARVVKRKPEVPGGLRVGALMLLDGLADEIIDIADDATQDYVVREGPNGERVVVVDLERIKRDRLRVGQRKCT